MRDVESARSMYYDDEDNRGSSRNAVLDIPVTDFELSVRSRNCLKKMNIKTLGDLLRTTEQELLSYKNFGETSLNEIKQLLAQKGLRLGQSVDGAAAAGLPATLAAVPGAAAPAIARRPAMVAGDIPAEVLAKSVGDLELSVRSRKALQRLNINSLGRAGQPYRGRTARLQELRHHQPERDQAAVDQLQPHAPQAGRVNPLAQAGV